MATDMKMGAEPNPIHLEVVSGLKENAHAARAGDETLKPVDVSVAESADSKGSKSPARGCCGKSIMFWVVITVVTLIVVAGLVLVLILVLDDDGGGDETDCTLNTTAFARRVAAENSVFSAMSSWGAAPAKAKPNSMVATMYMQTNDMSMTDTDFSVNSRRSSGRRSEEEPAGRRASYENRRRSPCAGVPQPAPPPDSNIRTKSFGMNKFDLTMYMNVNEMLMKNTDFSVGNRRRKTASTTIKSNNFPTNPKTRRRKVVTLAADNANTFNLFMSNNALTMETTTFTMNVGTSRRSDTGPELSEDEYRRRDEEDRRAGNSVTLTTLNINMYMCHNQMSMTNTYFTMNAANADLATTDISGVSSGNDLSSTITQLIPLVLQGFADSRRYGQADFWNWLVDAAAGRQTLTVNMYMYKNTLSMTDTTFVFNAGGSRRSFNFNSDSFKNVNASDTFNEETNIEETQDDVEEGEQPAEESQQQEPPMEIQEGRASSAFRRLLGQSNRRSNRRAPAKNKYLDSSSKTMRNTIVDMDVGGSRRTARRAGSKKMSMSKLNIKMMMYNNEMSMQTTVFAWNVG